MAGSIAITCLTEKDCKLRIDSLIWYVIYSLFVQISSSLYIAYTLIEMVGPSHRSWKRIIIEIVVFSAFLFLCVQDGFSIIFGIFCALFYIIIIVDATFYTYTQMVVFGETKNQNVISSMMLIQIICFIVIVMSIYGICIDPFTFCLYLQVLQYSMPAGYMLTEAIIVNRNMSDNNDSDNNSMSEDLI